MKEPPSGEFFVWTLFRQLVRRDFALGLSEYAAVLLALRQGFGWSSRDELKKVLCALWASSREETAVVSALFEQYVITDWNAASPVPSPDPAPVTETALPLPLTSGVSTTNAAGADASASPSKPPELSQTSRLPPLRPDELPRLPYSHVFLPQYPVSYRHVAQTWRRLRWPLREGPPVELDVEATIAQRCRSGVASPPVLRPRRRNRARLLLLVDRKGSMAPYRGYVDEVCTAIAEAGRLGHVGLFNFHDTPLEGADLSLLARLGGQLFPSLDPILPDIAPLISGEFYRDPGLLDPCPAADVFKTLQDDTAIVIVSDAGAARGRFDPVRILDTIASLKGLYTFSSRLAWLNPVPARKWGQSSAKSIARHVPMFSLDRDGMHRAVNVLRGQPFTVERPLRGSGQAPQYRPAAKG